MNYAAIFNKDLRMKRKKIGFLFPFMETIYQENFLLVYGEPSKLKNYSVDAALKYIKIALLIAFAPRFETI